MPPVDALSLDGSTKIIRCNLNLETVHESVLLNEGKRTGLPLVIVSLQAL